ncbi:hypothetical protein E4U43_002277 [Claviceps pusilla]|uniref:Uncharacterized protein n=1 Tax=Claviceps pusilla TaxID=123648 RepID=A0A9P7N6J3_9HYPO|nr:hypothetical protein E4U43_002277 [Claviceps pusilla]
MLTLCVHGPGVLDSGDARAIRAPNYASCRDSRAQVMQPLGLRDKDDGRPPGWAVREERVSPDYLVFMGRVTPLRTRMYMFRVV